MEELKFTIVFSQIWEDKNGDKYPCSPDAIKWLKNTFPVFNPVTTNLRTFIKETTTGRKVKKAIVDSYRDEFLYELDQMPPSKILFVGDTLFDTFLQQGHDDLGNSHGTFYKFGKHFVIPTESIDKVLNVPTKLSFVKRDIQRFIQLDPFTLYQEPTYDLVESYKPEKFNKVFLDIESTGLSFKDEITILAYTFDNGVPQVKLKPDKMFIQNLFDNIVENNATLIAHNATFDLSLLFYTAKKVYNDLLVEDTMNYAYVLGSSVTNLKHLVVMLTDRLGNNAYKKEEGYDTIVYAVEDILSMRQIYYLLKEKHKRIFSHLPFGTHAIDTINDLVVPLTKLHLYGMHVDKAKLEQLLKDLDQRAIEINQKLQEFNGGEINLRSPIQKAEMLLKAGVKLEEKTNSGNLKTDKKVLAQFSDNTIVDMTLELSELNTVVSALTSYLKLLDNNVLHTTLNLAFTDTGRLSSKNPNSQNISNKFPVKSIFTSRFENGYIGLVDLSQAELRVAAFQSGDILFAKGIATSDAHRTIASFVFDKPFEEVTSAERSISKTIAFGLLYGGTAAGIAYNAGLTKKEVERALKKFYGQFPFLKKWLTSIKNFAKRERYTETYFGRRRYLYDVLDDKQVERRGANTPIQSIASDLNLTIIRFIFKEFNRLKLKSVIITTVHDSGILDIHPDELDIVADVVQRAFKSLYELLKDSPVAKYLNIEGDLVISDSWLGCENKHEETYNPIRIYSCFSHEVENAA